MKLDVFYAAYQKKLHLGVLEDDGGVVRFFKDEAFDAITDIWPGFGGENNTGVSIAPNLVPSLFWDLLPTGYNAQILYKISHNNMLEIPVLKKLAMCSKNAIGAIEFEPSLPTMLEEKRLDLDAIEDDVQNEKNLVRLYRLLANINGHTPKITASVSKDKRKIYEKNDAEGFDEWIIKFSSSIERPDDGKAECVYAKMASAAGIEVPEFFLFESTKCAGYFGSKRFDRDGKNKIHTLSAGALMNKYYLNEQIGLMDYVRLVQNIAPDETAKLLKLLLFYMKTGNDDLRGTNISLIYKDNLRWTLAPAYDLVPFSLESDYTPKMLQSGYDKNEEDGKFYDLCELAGFDLSKVAEMIDAVESAIGQYEHLMQEY